MNQEEVLARARSLDPSGGPLPALLTLDPTELSFGERFCLFECANARCAVPMENIVQVLEIETMATVPLAPAHLCGVTFYENSVLPLIRISSGTGKPDVVAVLRDGDVRVGLAIEQVLGFRGLAETGRTRPPAVPIEIAGLVDGVRFDSDSPTFLLSVERLFAEMRPQETEVRS